MVGETFLRCLEFGASVFDMVSMAKTFKDVESPIDHLNSLQIQTLFDWSWVCGFTHCTSLSGFQHSFRISI